MRTKMKTPKKTFIFCFIIGAVLLLQFLYFDDKVITLPRQKWHSPQATKESANNFRIYVRLTKGGLVDNMEKWLLKSMKLFFLKKNLKLVVVLDNEKQEDHVYGNQFPKLHPEIDAEVCYMDPYDNNVDYGWGKARQYLDMMYADVCTTEEYVGFVDADTLFITAVTDDVLFEDNKPLAFPKFGFPLFPCWIQTAEYILQVKQVFQCMSYFPVIFKVAHIVEMREYVERMHNKSFPQVFKEAPPEKCPKVGAGSWCHFSIMCNYMWYYHRDEYAWHIQLVPLGKFDAKDAIPAMVEPGYFNHTIKESKKIPKPRSAGHARYLFYDGRYHSCVDPDPKWLNFFLREGLCFSFGFRLCPDKCSMFKENSIQESLFKFEQYNWLWDKRCNGTQQHHYNIVKQMQNNSADSFFINLENKDSFCRTLMELELPKAI